MIDTELGWTEEDIRDIHFDATEIADRIDCNDRKSSKDRRWHLARLFDMFAERMTDEERRTELERMGERVRQNSDSSVLRVSEGFTLGFACGIVLGKAYGREI